MILLVRHWLRLPLLTRRERRNLNGSWWLAVVDVTSGDKKTLDQRVAAAEAIEEFLAAIEWLEDMRA